MQSMHPKLSKTDPGMSLRCLNVFLCSFEFTFKTINCAILSKKWHFWVLTTRAAWIIKIDSKVVRTFWDRFWKVQTAYFTFLNIFQFFMHFCNPNGILQVWLPKPTVGTILPFWLQKGMKSERFLSAENVFEKYRSSAFQNRSQNVSTTSSYDFMPIWSLQKTPKKRGGGGVKKNCHI